MRRATISAAITLLAIGPAVAAPLCRDGKGLFTPCIGAPARARHRSDPQHEAAAPRDTATSAATSDARAARPARTRPPLIGRARSCRDGKGLYTPCPR